MQELLEFLQKNYKNVEYGPHPLLDGHRIVVDNRLSIIDSKFASYRPYYAEFYPNLEGEAQKAYSVKEAIDLAKLLLSKASKI